MRKIYPYHHYDLPRLSDWLNGQAAHGWELEIWGVFFVKFRKLAEGEGFNYQIDMDDTTGDPGIFRREELQKLGWEYVGTIGITRLHVYRHKDQYARLPRNEAYITFNQKKLNSELFWSGILGFLVIALLLYFFIIRNEFLLMTFMKQRKSLLLFYAVWFFVLLYQAVGETYRNVRLYRYLESYGMEPLAGNKKKKETRSFCFRPKFASWFILIFYALAIFGIVDKDNVENLEEADASLRYVDLAEIEGDDFEITDISWDEYPDVNFGNRIEYKNVPLARIYYEINQYGENRTTGEYIQMEELYWDVKRVKTADKLFEELIECSIKYPYGYAMGNKKYTYEEGKLWTMSEISDERFTELVVATANGFMFEGEQRIFARIGNRIIYIRHIGTADAEKLVEAIVQNFT